MKKYCAILLVSVMAIAMHGQDSTIVESTISIETKGSGALTRGKRNIRCVTCFLETIQDNPFHHFAIYSGITHNLKINKKYNIETGIYLEERSFSGGSNTVDNWIVYPKILLTGHDTIRLFNNDFSYTLKGGDFWNEDVNDMLRMHNIDYHGLTAELGFRGYSLGLFIIGDLSKNVGVGLHQYTKFYLKKKTEKIETTFFLGDNQLTDYDQHVTPEDFNIGNHTSLLFSDKFSLESQLEFRVNPNLGTSFAAGVGFTGNVKNLSFRSNLKYYQADFNLGYITDGNLYRGRSSYVGEQLYPLKNYFRTYSQWGNYTKQQGQDQLGFELQVQWEQPISKKLSCFVDGDLNIIGNPKTQNGRTIPLYTVGLRTNYFSFLKTEFFFTNKHMNLDSFYQTFQASTAPFFGGSVSLDLRDIRLRRHTFATDR